MEKENNYLWSLKFEPTGHKSQDHHAMATFSAVNTFCKIFH